MGYLRIATGLLLLTLSVSSTSGDTGTMSTGSSCESLLPPATSTDVDLPLPVEPWDISNFLQVHDGRWEYLDDIHVGTYGEFIGKPIRGIGAWRAMKVYQYEGCLLLCASEDLPILGMKQHDRLALVDPGGQVTLLISDSAIAAKLPSTPHHWPVSLQDGRPRALEPGEMLFSPTANYSTDADPPPVGNTGWVMLGIEGLLFVPNSGDPRPENILWIVPKAQGGFKLVWGGPKRGGELMMEVENTGKVTLGENTPYSLETRRGGSKRWDLRRGGEPAMIPDGFGMYPLTDGMTSRWISDDGEIRAVTTRY